MAIPVRPTDNLPRFADTTATIIEPPEWKKDLGWSGTEKPPHQWFNWLHRTVYRFVKYATEILDRMPGGYGGDLESLTIAAGVITPTRASCRIDNLNTERVVSIIHNDIFAKGQMIAIHCDVVVRFVLGAGDSPITALPHTRAGAYRTGYIEVGPTGFAGGSCVAFFMLTDESDWLYMGQRQEGTATQKSAEARLQASPRLAWENGLRYYRTPNELIASTAIPLIHDGKNLVAGAGRYLKRFDSRSGSSLSDIDLGAAASACQALVALGAYTWALCTDGGDFALKKCLTFPEDAGALISSFDFVAGAAAPENMVGVYMPGSASTQIWIACPGTNEIRRFDVVGEGWTTAVDTGAKAHKHLYFDGRYVWATDEGNDIYRYDPANPTSPPDEYTDANFTNLAGIESDGKYIYVGDIGTDEVHILNRETGAFIVSIAAAAPGPRVLMFDGSRIWVGHYEPTTYETAKVSYIVPSTRTSGGPFEIGVATEREICYALAFDGLWVWGHDGNALNKFHAQVG